MMLISSACWSGDPPVRIWISFIFTGEQSIQQVWIFLSSICSVSGWFLCAVRLDALLIHQSDYSMLESAIVKPRSGVAAVQTRSMDPSKICLPTTTELRQRGRRSGSRNKSVLIQPCLLVVSSCSVLNYFLWVLSADGALELCAYRSCSWC